MDTHEEDRKAVGQACIGATEDVVRVASHPRLESVVESSRSGAWAVSRTASLDCIPSL